MTNISQKQLLDKYVTAVMSAPGSLGLTATAEPVEFWERHVLDALKIVDLLPNALHSQKLRVIDIGSGNGIPGIPIAIALPHWQVFLLDSNSKKTGFLDMFCKFNQIENVHVLTGRAESLAHLKEHREHFDIVFARALGKLPTALEFTLPFLKRDGLLLIPHGSSYKSELAKSETALKLLGGELQSAIPYQLNSSVPFSALIFHKTKETPESYPRKPGIPGKRPL